MIASIFLLTACSDTKDNPEVGDVYNEAVSQKDDENRGLDKTSFEVALQIPKPGAVKRAGEVVSGGIPFAPGVLFDPDQLQVSDGTGQVVPTQAHQLGISWPDGSVRWALLQFVTEPTETTLSGYSVQIGSKTSLEKRPSVKVNKSSEKILIDTGSLRAHFTKTPATGNTWSAFPERIEIVDGQNSFVRMDHRPDITFVADREHMTKAEFAGTGAPPNSLWSFGLGGVEDMNDPLWNVYAQPREVAWYDWRDQIKKRIDYSKFFSGPVDYHVEESGPVRAVVSFESARNKSAGEIGYRGRVYAYAGAKYLRVELTVINFEERPTVKVPNKRDLTITNTKHLKIFRIGFTPNFDADALATSLDESKYETDLAEGRESVSLRQLEANQAVIVRGREDQVTGERSRGWMSVKDNEGGSITLANKFFWEIYPKGLNYDVNRNRLNLELWPTQKEQFGFPYTPGRVRTYEFVLGFDEEGDKFGAIARTPLRPYPGADYVSSTGAATPAIPLKNDAFPKYSNYVARTVKRWVEEQRLLGDLHFGDQQGWSRGSTASGYHGVGNEFFMFYLSSGDPLHFRIAEAAVWHDMDIDRIHWGKQSGEHQKQHNRGKLHLTAIPLGGIAVWNFGDVDYYFLTGKRRILRTLEDTTDFLLQAGGVTASSFSQKRATSLPFKHLTYIYEAIGDEGPLSQLYPEKYTLENYPKRTDSIGRGKSLALLKRMRQMSRYMRKAYLSRDPGTPFQQSAFQSSYPAEAQYRFWRLTGDRKAAEGVEIAADYLYHEYIHPTGIPKFRDHAPSVDEGSHRAAQSWRPFYDETDLPAARAYQVSGDSAWLEYVKASLDWRLNILGIARDKNGFGSTIPTTLWVMREAGFGEEDLRDMRPDLDYDAALESLDKVIPNLPKRYSNAMLLEGTRVLMNLHRYDDAEKWLSRCKGEASRVNAFTERIEELRSEAEM